MSNAKIKKSTEPTYTQYGWQGRQDQGEIQNKSKVPES
jgi:hypothetical protein